MVACSVDFKGMIHHEVVPPKHVVNKELYLQVLECLG